MCGNVSRVSQRINIVRLVKRIFMNTSVLIHCYFEFVLPILMYFSLVWESAAECHLQFIELQVYSVVRPCPDQSFLSMCHQRRVVGLHEYVEQSEFELQSLSVHRASICFYYVEFDIPVDFEVSRCRTSKFTRCFLPA